MTPVEGLREQGVSLADIDARLASGYAEFKQPLMVAVADVSALRAALTEAPPLKGLREALDALRGYFDGSQWEPDPNGAMLWWADVVAILDRHAKPLV